jgi:hypothetical protein
MRMAEPDLAALQHWMQRHIVGEGAPADESPLAAARGPGLGDLIRGSPRLLAEQRLAIYARSYLVRLIECLREEFPALRLLVGDQVFDLFASAYLASRPSASYSLYELGAGFADFLEATRPVECDGAGCLEAIPAGLARLERAISEAQRGVGIESVRDPDLVLHPLLLFAPGVQLRLPDTVRLLRLDFDFSETLASARRGEPPRPPPAREMLIAVGRSRYEVRVHALEPPRFAWLQAIGRQGADVQSAAVRAARSTHRDAGAIMADLLAWLPTAVFTGLVTKSHPVPDASLALRCVGT